MPALLKYRPAFILAALALASALALAGCSGATGDMAGDMNGAAGAANTGSPAAANATAGSPSKARQGEIAFNARCAICHGANAAGTAMGPPLAHRIYEPGHHQDFAFRNAVRNGVTAHHWQFGNMPPLPGVSDRDVDAIICYVRELQLAAGIYQGPSPC